MPVSKVNNEFQLSLFPSELINVRVPPTHLVDSHRSSAAARLTECTVLKSIEGQNFKLVSLFGRVYPMHVRRRRGRINLRVEGGNIVLGAPKLCSDRRIAAFVIDNRRWLKKQIERSADFNPRHDEQGRAQLLIGGQWCSLVLVNGACAAINDPSRVELSAGCLKLVGRRPAECAALLIDWMSQRTTEQVGPMITDYADRLKVSYRRVRISDFKTQWGSCRRLKDQYRLSFSCRLAMMPQQVLAYIILHELCHCRVFDHSQRFWQLLDQHYQSLVGVSSDAARAWLNRHDAQLRVDLVCLMKTALAAPANGG